MQNRRHIYVLGNARKCASLIWFSYSWNSTVAVTDFVLSKNKTTTFTFVNFIYLFIFQTLNNVFSWYIIIKLNNK